MEIDAFWRGGARPALQLDGGRNLFQKKFGAGLRLRGRAGPGPPPAQSRAGLRLRGAAWGWPTPAYPAHMSATRVRGDSWGIYLSFSPDFLA
jgi:hypothetical protein